MVTPLQALALAPVVQCLHRRRGNNFSAGSHLLERKELATEAQALEYLRTAHPSVRSRKDCIALGFGSIIAQEKRNNK